MTSDMADAPDTKEKTLPPWAPWAMAVVIIMIAAFAIVKITDEPPVVSGEITKVFAVEQASGQRVLVGIEVRVKNITDKELLLRNVHASIKAGGQEHSDRPAAAGDHSRYFQAYPLFKQSDAPPLPFETKLAPGEEKRGLFIVTYPVNKQTFDGREELRLSLGFFGRKLVIVTEGAKQ